MQIVSPDKVSEKLEDLYINMDLSIPENSSCHKSPSNASNSPDFEFDMSSSSAYDTASDLFSTKPPLPLHFLPGVLVVQRLSASGQRSQLPQQEVEAEPNQIGGCLREKDFQEKSLRHSSRSSQGSYISSKDHLRFTPAGTSKSCSQQLSSYGQAAEKSSSWLTAAFPWKVLFGIRKTFKMKLGKTWRRSPRFEDKKIESNTFRVHQAKFVSSSLRVNKEARGITTNLNERIDQQREDFGQKYVKASSKLEPGPFRIKHKSSCRSKDRYRMEKPFVKSNSVNVSSNGSSFAKQPSCSSFYPRNLRVASFVRRSSAPNSRVNSSHCSPTHIGVIPSFNYHSISEMQNFVQGAIAHCKQSHASNKTGC